MPGARPGWWRRWPVLAAAALAAIVLLVVLVWVSPAFAVRAQAVVGARAVSEQQVLDTLRVARGTPLMRVDTEAAARRVARIPKVASVRVQRVFPSTIRVTVVERVPVVFTDSPQGPHLLDGSGAEFAIEPPPPGLPKLVLKSPGPPDEAAKAALAVLTGMPEPLRVQVGEVAAPSISDMKFILRDGRQVLWGTADNSPRKAANTLAVLTRPGKIYDVSSSVPVVRE